MGYVTNKNVFFLYNNFLNTLITDFRNNTRFPTLQSQLNVEKTIYRSIKRHIRYKLTREKREFLYYSMESFETKLLCSHKYF